MYLPEYTVCCTVLTALFVVVCLCHGLFYDVSIYHRNKGEFTRHYKNLPIFTEATKKNDIPVVSRNHKGKTYIHTSLIKCIIFSLIDVYRRKPLVLVRGCHMSIACVQSEARRGEAATTATRTATTIVVRIAYYLHF